MKNNIIGGSLPLKCLDMVMNLDFSQHWRAPFLDLLELTVWKKKNDLLYTFQSIFLWTIKIFIERSKSVRNSLEVEKKETIASLESDLIKQIIHETSKNAFQAYNDNSV